MEEFIAKNYDKLFGIAKVLTHKSKNPHIEAGDLMSETVFTFLNRKTPLPPDVKGDRLFLFFYSAMHLQYFSKSSSYNRVFKNTKSGGETNKYNRVEYYNVDWYWDNDSDDDRPGVTDNNEQTESLFSNENKERQVEQVKNILNKLESDGKIDWYDKKLFKMYFFPNEFFTLEDYDGDVSFRKMENILGINFQTIRLTVNKVAKLVKKQINK